MQNQNALASPDPGSSILEEKIALYARVPHYVLITGERGTGKTTIARKLHEQSPRSKREFVSVNCASFTSELLESELFGYEKGAFTGAASAKAGLFETSGGGTLFLDEIGELTLSLQAKLLKAVEEKRIRRVGGTYEREIDVRIVAATSRNLKKMVRDGSFRPDLFDRLNILQLETIPLRCQKEKIRYLFLSQMEVERSSVGRVLPFVIDEAALCEIERSEWKGNYRELRNFAARLAVESMDLSAITLDIVRKFLAPKSSTGPAGAAMPLSEKNSHHEAFGEEFAERNFVTVLLDPESDDLDSIYVKAAATFIEHALTKSNGSLRHAARSMNTTHSTLSRILRKHKERSANASTDSQLRALTYSAAA
ncbi:MAG TPA: sigma 54-interacting transcriptional regulator [Pyrinomonadaceae bacterium]|nr:sigma 54-interacting transcriptional regulator [Pyrinomonadaceae bacterium]HMP64786.1 sigma 54-interacting transcriptional regulator [Pyrinomonadaceae bacterium]